MEENSDYKLSFAMITDKNLDHLKEITEKVKKLPTVSKVDSLAEYIPSDQDEKIKIIKKFKPILGNFRIALKDNDQSDADYVAVLDQMGSFFEEAQEKAFAGGQTKLVGDIDSLMKNMDKVKKKLSEDKQGTELARTRRFEKELFTNIEKGTQIIRESLNPAKITEETFPKEIISRFKSPQGTYVAMVSPKGSIWNIDFLDKFVNDLKSITPDVTGFPITHRVYVRMAASAIIWAMVLSLSVILILLIIDFRKVNEVLLALMPLIIGMLWLQLVMYIFRIDYNVANIGGLPLLLGLGIVYGLRIVHRWREDKSITAFAAVRTTGKGLAFAALAIMVGLFSIIPARHKGVSSFGMILFIGIICCMFTALVILPAAIDYIYLMKNKEKVPELGAAPVAREPEPASGNEAKGKPRQQSKKKATKKPTVKKAVKKSSKKKK